MEEIVYKTRRICRGMPHLREEIYTLQKGKCFYCLEEFDLKFLESHHLFNFLPLENISHSIQTMVLCCPNCHKSIHSGKISEFEFMGYISHLMNTDNRFRNVRSEVMIGNDIRADIIAEEKRDGKWVKLLVEIKNLPSMTIARIEGIIKQLHHYKSALSEDVIPVTIIPGIVTDKERELFEKKGVEVWDMNHILNEFVNDKSLVINYLSGKVNGVYQTSEKSLIELLKIIPSGKENWSLYQNHIKKILSYLFSEILSEPLYEMPDKENVNRRDFILRNYCEGGFWKYLREMYKADFIVIDAKNYTEGIKKEDILQITNYLKDHGAGLFAIIFCRNGKEENGSYITRRDKWITEKKMVIILNDNDVEKMILSKQKNLQPEEVIKQKIEDFRLEM